MKSSILSLLLCVFIASIGQTQDRTIFNRSNIETIGGFGGPILQVARIGDRSAPAFGGGGGVVIDDFFIGGFGAGFGVEDWREGLIDQEVSIGYGGLWLGYSFLDEKLVHPYVSLQAAVGGLEISTGDIADLTLEEFTIGIINPEIGAEINITEWFKFSPTVGYRWINNFDKTDVITPEDIRNFYLGLNFRFGYFGG